MGDLAAALGATLISEETGMKLDTVTMKQLGRCSKVTITKDDTVFVGGAGDKAAVEERVSLIKSTMTTT